MDTDYNNYLMQHKHVAVKILDTCLSFGGMLD